MKNFLAIVAVAVLTLAIPSENAEAGGKRRGKVAIQNVNASGGRAITIVVVPAADAAAFQSGGAKKSDALKFPRRNVRALKTESLRLKNGDYVVVAGDTISFNSLGRNDEIPLSAVNFRAISVNNNTVTLRTNTGQNSSPFRPNLF